MEEKSIFLTNFYSDIKIEEFMKKNYIRGDITASKLIDENKEYIFNQLKIEQKESLNLTTFNDITTETLIPYGIEIKVNTKYVTKEISIIATNLQEESYSFNVFSYEKIENIIQDPEYKVDENIKITPQCNVWGWFKSLYHFDDEEIELKETSCFFDLTKFLISLDTSVSKNGGNFTIKLPIIERKRKRGYELEFQKGQKGTHLRAYRNSRLLGQSDALYSAEERIVNKKRTRSSMVRKYDDWNSYKDYYDRKEFILDIQNGFYTKLPFSTVHSGFFNWLINTNDLIFIGFEKLKMEYESEISKGTDYKRKGEFLDIDSKLNNQVYDMIGLIDDVSLVTDSQSCTAYLQVTGRDLIKLLIDDGSYFFNSSVTFDPKSVFLNQNQGGDAKDSNTINSENIDPLNRLRWISGEIDIFQSKLNMTIDYIIKGLISQLSNIEIVPSDVFRPWGEERTRVTDFKTKEKK